VLAFVHALQNREFQGLREAVQDRWHQPVRAALVPQLTAVLALEDPDILGAFLSGAGPSVAVLVRHGASRAEQVLKALYERAGTAAVVRTLSVHQSAESACGAVRAAHGSTV
jgi:homoserine kinase